MKGYRRLQCEAGPLRLLTVPTFSLYRFMVGPVQQLPRSLAQIHLSLNTYNCVFENSNWKLSTTLWKGCRQKSQQWEIRRAKNLVKLHWHFSKWEQNFFFVLSVKFLACSWQRRLLHSKRKGPLHSMRSHLFMLFLLPFKVKALNLKPVELPGLQWIHEPLEITYSIVWACLYVTF